MKAKKQGLKKRPLRKGKKIEEKKPLTTFSDINITKHVDASSTKLF